MESRKDEINRKKAVLDFLMRLLVGLSALALFLTLGLIIFDLQTGMDQRNLILSCTTPTGKCNQEGQKRTASAVREIDRQNAARAAVTRQISVYAAYCSQLPDVNTVPQFEHCISRLLKIEGDSFNYQSKKGGKR